MPLSARVLVVEDNDRNYDLARFLLENLGLSVSRASTGQQALAMVAAEPPALILMDIQLPGLDGLAVTRELRSCS